MPELTLYILPNCPYCHKVLRFMKDNEISLSVKDINAKPENRKELLTIGGKTQAPCLVIDGKALYESDDIIEWLEKNLKK